MPIIGFTLIGIGGIFIYSGYQGYSPAQIVKAILDGKLSTLPKIPIDPRKRGQQTTPQTPGTPANPPHTPGQGIKPGAPGSPQNPYQ
jgi:hypothetical protein